MTFFLIWLHLYIVKCLLGSICIDPDPDYDGARPGITLQIELVVEKLKERSRRILVVLPHCYTQKVMPNSIRQRRTRRGSVQQSIDDLVRMSPPTCCRFG